MKNDENKRADNSPDTRDRGSKVSCQHSCGAGEGDSEHSDLQDRLSHIDHIILVLSGKGGVGKSTVAVNLAYSLLDQGFRVGLLDIDVHGPSIPSLLNLTGHPVTGTGRTICPVTLEDHLRIMSVGLILRSRNDAVIWRGPLKHQVIKQFLQDVEWGDLDYLIVDSPPGTGDEPLSVVQLIVNPDGAVIVTTPQQVAISDVRKCITFCRQLNLPVLGVIENMSGFTCPHCSQDVDIFSTGGGETMAEEMDVPFLARIPIDPHIVRSGENGTPYVRAFPESKPAEAFREVTQLIVKLGSKTFEPGGETKQMNSSSKPYKIAVPVTGGRLSSHFGHCEQFALFEIDQSAKTIINTIVLDAPPHQPGLLPKWLHEQGARSIIAGGMGSRAQNLFLELGIKVVTGAGEDNPTDLILGYLNGTMQTGANVCDH